MTRIPCALLCFILMAALPGCWEGHEVNTLAHGLGVGIDTAPNDKIELTAQIVIPQKISGQGGGGGGGGGEAPVWNLGIVRKSTLEAAREVTTRSGRRMFWGHLEVIVLGEDYARRGISEFLDSISRQWELRRLTFVTISEGKARDVLGVQPKLETISAMFIRDLLHSRDVASEAPAVTLNDILVALSEEGIEPLVPRIRIVNRPKKEGQKGKASEGNQGSDGKEGKPPSDLELSGSAVFKGHRMVGWLDGRETRGVLWTTGKVSGAAIVVNGPATGQPVTIEIRRASARQVYSPRDGRPAMRIVISAYGDLGETEPGEEPSQREISAIERRVAEAIRLEVQSALTKAQKRYKSDVFGFGRTIEKYHPQEWRRLNWEREFPDLEVEVDVKCKITGTGLTIQPPRSR